MNEQHHHILVVDDDARLRDLLTRYLGEQGFEVKAAADGQQMDKLRAREHYHLIVLDLMMPGEDGLSICRRLRGQGDQTPIIMLTAKGDELSRIKGLELGADDYLAKPFEVAELEARIKSLLRRSGNVMPTVHVGRLEFDTTSRLASVDGKALSLTPRELAVLEALVSRLGKPVSRNALFEKVFSFDDDARVEAIEIYVHRLRKKLEGTGAYVSTLRGLGYVLSESGNEG